MCASRNPAYDQPRLVYTTVPDGLLEPLVDPVCPHASLTPTTIIDRFSLTVEKWGRRPVMALKRPAPGSSAANLPAAWKVWSWLEYHQECSKFAKTLTRRNPKRYCI